MPGECARGYAGTRRVPDAARLRPTRSLAKLLGGELHVSDRDDGAHGVRFQLRLPLVPVPSPVDAHAVTLTIPAAADLASPGTHSGHERTGRHLVQRTSRDDGPAADASWGRLLLRQTVLVVDDMAGNRRLARRMLTNLGCGVVEAGDGDEVVRAIQGARPPVDVVLMDIEMARMGGVGAVQAMRAAGVAIPVIAVTGATDAAHVPECTYDAPRLTGSVCLVYLPGDVVSVTRISKR